MAKKTRTLLFVIVVGVLTAVISFFKSGEFNLFTLLQAGIIASLLNLLILLYEHYGWRMVLLKNAATSPNFRGTWEFEKPDVFSITKLCKYDNLKGGYLTVQQSDSHILVNILWDGDEPSELRIKSPTAVNQDRCSFSGHFVEHPAESTHGFGAFITFSSRYPSKFVLRYRTDHGVTGEIKAENRKPWIANTIKQAKKDSNRVPTLNEKVLFAMRWN
ncbi:hypothetical protein A6779_17090 [Marinobacter adhaerens]|uniref:SMODS-associating 2TM beta-strand rich effector domain-containing protein n=1 Tax=Marinobacter salsuginis TaxID=418719 RepID=A0A5M3PRS0_9GAMM|nr:MULTISPECIES: hypothetical protein [Marinobacter]ODM24647.1 hypothetical protein A6779_17090 [Marinobacter adhaerens]GBO85429.1 hypothetical protein MS5N3_28800 [Marinobacter salsuginis]